jgi:hypothetical protein
VDTLVSPVTFPTAMTDASLNIRNE